MIDMETPLVMLSPNDPWTVRDSFEGVQVFGGTGSGKTSGSGQTFANAFLRADYGGLVLTVKPDESEQWRYWAEAHGRADQIVTIKPNTKYFFDFLEYEATRGDGSDTDTVTSLFMMLIEIANGGSIQSKDAYWLLALRQLLRNAIDTLKCAGQGVTIENMYKLIVTAPTSLMQLASDDYRDKSYCYKCLHQAGLNADEAISQNNASEHHFDFEIAFMYFTSEFPNLAEKTRSIVVSMFTTTADSFMRGTLRQIFSTADGKQEIAPDLAHKGAIIIVDLPIKKHDEVGKIGQGVYKLMFQKAMERTPFEQSGRPVFLWADENQFFINSYDLEFQQTARSSGVATFYLTQNLPNYHTNLGDNGEIKASSLLGNLSTKIFHANADSKTNEWAAKLIGEDWEMQASSSVSNSDNQTSSVSEQRRFFVEPIRFTELARGGVNNNYAVQSIIHQIGRNWSNGGKYINAIFKQR